MNNRKELADLILHWADNPDSYFTIEGVKSNYIPSPESKLEVWKLIIPPKKWEPKIYKYNAIYHTTRETVQQANDLERLLKEIATIDALACEFGYKKEFEYDKPNYYIFYYAGDKKWTYTNVYYSTQPGRIYMTEEGCRLLCEKLNSGEVELN